MRSTAVLRVIDCRARVLIPQPAEEVRVADEIKRRDDLCVYGLRRRAPCSEFVLSSVAFSRVLLRRTFPAGMEPTGVERHRRSPQGERVGASESIEAQAKAHSKRVSDTQSLEERSRREWSRWESSDIDEARRVSERERANQSKFRCTHVPSVPNSQSHRERSRRESNPHLRFRKPLFYPLNYGNNTICDFRFAIADCKWRRRAGVDALVVSFRRGSV